MTKKYKVSLAILCPRTYEIEIEAHSPDQARVKAIMEYEARTSKGAIVDYSDTGESQSGFDEELDHGIEIEEI